MPSFAGFVRVSTEIELFHVWDRISESSLPLKSPTGAEVPNRSHATVAITRMLAKRATVFGHCMGEDHKSTIEL